MLTKTKCESPQFNLFIENSKKYENIFLTLKHVAESISWNSKDDCQVAANHGLASSQRFEASRKWNEVDWILFPFFAENKA